jgi:hypothetical protein
MQTVSLPLELLIKIVMFALDDDHEEYHVGSIGEIPEWKTPNQNTLDRVLRRELRSDTLVLAAHVNASGVNAETGESPRGVVKDEGGVTEPTRCTYAVTTALRLYVIIIP